MGRPKPRKQGSTLRRFNRRGSARRDETRERSTSSTVDEDRNSLSGSEPQTTQRHNEEPISSVQFASPVPSVLEQDGDRMRKIRRATGHTDVVHARNSMSEMESENTEHYVCNESHIAFGESGAPQNVVRAVNQSHAFQSAADVNSPTPLTDNQIRQHLRKILADSSKVKSGSGSLANDPGFGGAESAPKPSVNTPATAKVSTPELCQDMRLDSMPPLFPESQLSTANYDDGPAPKVSFAPVLPSKEVPMSDQALPNPIPSNSSSSPDSLEDLNSSSSSSNQKAFLGKYFGFTGGAILNPEPIIRHHVDQIIQSNPQTLEESTVNIIPLRAYFRGIKTSIPEGITLRDFMNKTIHTFYRFMGACGIREKKQVFQGLREYYRERKFNMNSESKSQEANGKELQEEQIQCHDNQKGASLLPLSSSSLYESNNSDGNNVDELHRETVVARANEETDNDDNANNDNKEDASLSLSSSSSYENNDNGDNGNNVDEAVVARANEKAVILDEAQLNRRVQIERRSLENIARNRNILAFSNAHPDFVTHQWLPGPLPNAHYIRGFRRRNNVDPVTGGDGPHNLFDFLARLNKNVHVLYQPVLEAENNESGEESEGQNPSENGNENEGENAHQSEGIDEVESEGESGGEPEDEDNGNSDSRVGDEVGGEGEGENDGETEHEDDGACDDDIDGENDIDVESEGTIDAESEEENNGETEDEDNSVSADHNDDEVDGDQEDEVNIECEDVVNDESGNEDEGLCNNDGASENQNDGNNVDANEGQSHGVNDGENPDGIKKTNAYESPKY